MIQRDDIFSKNERLISKEAGLAATCLEQGLTALRKANFTQKWNYYQGFFLITIGMERLLKLTIITIYRIEENKLPNNGELRKYGHDIEQLFLAVSNHVNPSNNFLLTDSLYPKIISFLSEYASISRYYNLDSLSGKERTLDPLHKWKETQDEIARRHCKPIEISPMEDFLIGRMSSFSSVFHTDELDKPITDYSDFYLQGKNIDKIQGYSIYYLYSLVCHITDQLKTISSKKYLMPVLSEFFPLFSNRLTKQEILKRKNWNNLTTNK